MISKKDSKPFLIKQAIGGQQTTKEDTIYEENWTTVYGLIGEPSGFIAKRLYGLEESYDKIIVVNATADTRAIQPNTLIMLDDMPTSNYEYGDYDIARIFPEYNGEITIGLRKRTAVDMPKLYFIYNGSVLYYQLNFDKSTLKAYVRSNIKLPIKNRDNVWTRKPASAQATSHKLVLRQQVKTGYDGNYQPFIELRFDEVKES